MVRFFLLLLISISLLSAKTGYPKIGNYFLDPSIRANEIDSLAKCDFLVLDHEVSRRSPEIIDSIRKLNPDIEILAYMVSEEMELNADQWKGSLRSSMLAEIQENWWLKTSGGGYLSFWPGTRMLNIAAGQPEISSIKWNRYLAGVVNDSILSDSRWDGIYIDNCWSTIHWLDSTIDYDRNGIADDPDQLDSLWESGMNLLLELIRLENPSKLIVGNGGYRYGKYLNGALFEDFPVWGGWWQLYDHYRNLETNGVKPSRNFINATTSNSGTVDLRQMRFGLVTALMGNGCFSYDYGANDHSQHWWFDEYDANLGEPLEPVQVANDTKAAESNFESGWNGWNGGDWKMITSIVTDSIWKSSAFHAEVSGEEEWNELISSPVLSVAEGSLLKCSVRIRVDTADAGANLYMNLREGDKYDSSIDMGTIPLSGIHDTVLTFYTDSAFTGSGRALIIGLQGGGTVSLDDIVLESSENLTLTRKFQNGLAVLNPSPLPKTFHFPGYHRIKGSQDPVHNDGSSAESVTIALRDGIVLIADNLSSHPVVNRSVSASFIQNANGITIHAGSTGITTAKLSDLKGRVVRQVTIPGGESAVINSGEIGSGVYTISIESETVHRFGKIRL